MENDVLDKDLQAIADAMNLRTLEELQNDWCKMVRRLRGQANIMRANGLEMQDEADRLRDHIDGVQWCLNALALELFFR